MKNFPGPLRQNGSIGNILSFVLLTEVLLSVQSLSRVQLFATLWSEARQASLSITNSRSLPKLMSIESVMPSSHLILCRPLLPLSIFQVLCILLSKKLQGIWNQTLLLSFSTDHNKCHITTQYQTMLTEQARYKNAVIANIIMNKNNIKLKNFLNLSRGSRYYYNTCFSLENDIN